MSVSIDKLNNLLTETLSAVSTEIIVATIVAFFLTSMIAALIVYSREKRKLNIITEKIKSTEKPTMVFKKDKLIWASTEAQMICPNIKLGTSASEVHWKFSGIMEQVVSLYKNTYTLYTLDAIEVNYTPTKVTTISEIAETHAKVETRNYKIFSDEMELFEDVLSTNSYLLMAAEITVFAERKNCDLDQIPKFEQLSEAFLRIGHYLLKDKSNAHIDFLFDKKDGHCFIQMNLKNFKASSFAFGEDFFLKGFGSEAFEYQLNRLEVLFESLGGSLQIIEAGKDFVLIGKVRTITTLAAYTNERFAI